MTVRPFPLFLLLSLLACCSLLLSLASGSIETSLRDLAGILLGDGQGLAGQVVRELRWPRAAAAFVTGGLLSLAGGLMQVLLRNPLADPGLFGIAPMAALGAVASFWIGATWALPLAALAGAGLAMALLALIGLFNLLQPWLRPA